MTEEIDAVMFDAGGTLIDLRPSKDFVFHKVLSEHGFRVSQERVAETMALAEREFDEESANLDGEHEDLFWDNFDKYVLDRLGFEGDGRKFAKDVSCEFEAIVPRLDSWIEFPDARPLLEDLREHDFMLGVISNATDLVRRVFDNLDLTRYFDSIIVSAEVGVRKPDARIFQLSAKRVNTSPNRIVYVGDKLAVDVVGAKRAGMNSVLIDRLNIYPDARCIRIRTLKELRRFL